MSAKSQDTKNSWVDPDDAPEITTADMERGEWFIGGVKVTPEEGKAAFRETLGKKQVMEPKQPNPPRTPLEQARRHKLAADLREELARLKQWMTDAQERISTLETEIIQIAAWDQANARRNYWDAIWMLGCAFLLCVGFIFFAELSLRAIGFDWEPLKLYFGAFVFWLGTVVAMHTYLTSLGESGSARLPFLFRVFPFLLIIIGVLVPAVARGLLAFLPETPTVEDADLIHLLKEIAKWCGLISQLVLSLGLDLASGVIAFIGVRKYHVAEPIWYRYKEIVRLSNHTSTWRDKITSKESELGNLEPTRQNDDKH